MAELDSEEAFLAPLLAPGVGADPVVNTVLLAPADDFDRVAASPGAGSVVVDAGFVIEKVLVDNEASLDGAIALDLRLDGSDTRRLDNAAAVAFPALDGGAIVAGAGALRDLASARDIGQARIRGDALGLDVEPAPASNATLAALVPLIAGDHVLRGESDILLAVGGEAEAVREGLGCGEGPA